MFQCSMSVHMVNPAHFEHIAIIQYFAQKVGGCTCSGKKMGLNTGSSLFTW